MNTTQITRLCTTCGLGKPIGELRAVTGGLLHRMWRLHTTQGSFAIKQLHPVIMRKPHIRTAYRLSEQIAAAMAAHGVPAVVALDCNGERVRDVDDITVIVYRWIEGEVLPSTVVEPGRARCISTILGQMHSLNLQMPEVPLPEWTHFLDDDWDMLTVHAYDQGIPWAHQVRATMPKLSVWSKLYEQAGETLSSIYVVSHRDLNPTNVLWSAEHTPYLIDWEAAGLVNPTMELVGVALDWSGFELNAVSEDTFAAVMERYVAAGGVVRMAGIDAIHGVLGVWLGWLLFNMRRSLGESISSEDERQMGVRETTHTLARLRLLAQHAELWASWVDRWRSS